MQPLITVADAISIGLIFSRLVAFFSAFPVINSNFVPLNVRIMLVIALSFFILKYVPVQTINVDNLSISWILLLVLKELIVGFALGILTQTIIAIFSYAAEIISYFMGLTIANVFDPTFGQVSVIDRFFILLFYLLFFVSGSYLVFLAGLIKSFEVIPLYKVDINFGGFVFILNKVYLLFLLALKMAFPLIVILLMVNVALALINRLIPQINVFIVGLPLQIFVGLLSLALGSAAIVFFANSVVRKFVEYYLFSIKAFGT